jgi:hypothetical protein
LNSGYAKSKYEGAAMPVYKCDILHRDANKVVQTYDNIQAISPQQARSRVLFRYAGALGILKSIRNEDDPSQIMNNPRFRIEYAKFLQTYDCCCTEIQSSVPKPIFKPKQQELPFEQRLRETLQTHPPQGEMVVPGCEQS